MRTIPRGKHSACLTVAWVPDLRRTYPNELEGITIVTTALAPSLTAADRCDRCGAQAYVRARLHAGGELLFCLHHSRTHLPKLRDLAEIDDETERLVETPAFVGNTA